MKPLHYNPWSLWGKVTPVHNVLVTVQHVPLLLLQWLTRNLAMLHKKHAVLLSQRKYLRYLEMCLLETFNVFLTLFLKKQNQKQTKKGIQTHPTSQNKQLPSLCFLVKFSSQISGSQGQSLTAGQLGRLKKKKKEIEEQKMMRVMLLVDSFLQ